MSDGGDGNMEERPEPLRVPVIDVTLRRSVVADEPDAERQLSPRRSQPAADASTENGQSDFEDRPSRVSIAPVKVISDVPPDPEPPANGVAAAEKAEDEDLSLSAEVPLEEEVAFEEEVPEDPTASQPPIEVAPEPEAEAPSVEVDPETAEALSELERDTGKHAAVPATPLPPPADPDEAAALEDSQALSVTVDPDYSDAAPDDDDDDAPEITIETEGPDEELFATEQDDEVTAVVEREDVPAMGELADDIATVERPVPSVPPRPTLEATEEVDKTDVDAGDFIF